MKTIELQIYTFAELSEEAKQTAINNYRESGIDTSYYWDEAQQTVKAFHEVFGTKSGHRSWLDVNTGHIDDTVMELKGLRLRTYLINNFWSSIYKGKYFSLWSKTEKSFKYYKDGYLVLKSRYSKVFFDYSCPLTGVCYDMDLLDPIVKFVNNYREVGNAESTNFQDLLEECFSSLRKSLESEDEYRESDECISETLIANDYEFTEDGNRH